MLSFSLLLIMTSGLFSNSHRHGIGKLTGSVHSSHPALYYSPTWYHLYYHYCWSIHLLDSNLSSSATIVVLATLDLLIDLILVYLLNSFSYFSIWLGLLIDLNFGHPLDSYLSSILFALFVLFLTVWLLALILDFLPTCHWPPFILDCV